METIAAADRFSFTVDARRVRGDDAFTLHLKAVFANDVKTLEIPVSIKEDMPDPVYTLQAPATWNGRDPIEVVPQDHEFISPKSQGCRHCENPVERFRPSCYQGRFPPVN